MATGKVLAGKPYARNPYRRFDEGEVASVATSRRRSLFYKVLFLLAVLTSLRVCGADVQRRLFLPKKLKGDVLPVNFQVNFKGRIRSFCGYEFGSIVKLPAEPTLDKHGNIIVTEKLKKPIYNCSDVELKYSNVNHALYSIRVFSPPQKKEMSDTELIAELDRMLDKFKEKAGNKFGSWIKLPQLFIAQIDKATGQWIMLNAYQGKAVGRQATTGTAPEKGWAFSVQVEDSLFRKYQPKAMSTGKEVQVDPERSARARLPILIYGPDEFVEKTEEALLCIKNGSPKSYELVTNNLSIIQRGKQSGVNPRSDPRIFRVGLITSKATLPWYASCIVHDAYHVKLYKDYRKKNHRTVPSEIFSGRVAENACISAQEEFLKDIDAPPGLISCLEGMRKIDYFSCEDRNW